MICLLFVLEILFDFFHALKSKLQSSDFPSSRFQPDEVSQDLVSGDLVGSGDLPSQWGPLWVCNLGQVSLSLSFFSRLLLRSLETRDVQLCDAVASSLWTPHRAS